MQGINESWKEFACGQQHPFSWYSFILSTAIVYYTMAVLSMLFSKESRRLREVSLLHDDLVFFLLFPSIVEWFGTSSKSLTPFVIRVSSHEYLEVDTCWFIVFLHSSLQASFVLAVMYTVYVENILLPKITIVNPRSVANFKWLVFQLLAGLAVAIITILIDTSDAALSSIGCCLHKNSDWTFKKTMSVTFDIASIFAVYVLLRVSIDRFLKLLVSVCHRSWWSK